MTLLLLAIIVFTTLILIYSIKSLKENIQRYQYSESNQNRVNVVLSNIPENKKTEVLKIIRTCMNLGLKEAKDLIENSEKININNVDYDFAINTKSKFERYGVTVDIEII